MSEEPKRHMDLDNLAHIPVILERIENVQKAIDEIKIITAPINSMKTDIHWLKKNVGWLYGVVSAVFIIMVGAIIGFAIKK